MFFYDFISLSNRYSDTGNWKTGYPTGEKGTLFPHFERRGRTPAFADKQGIDTF